MFSFLSLAGVAVTEGVFRAHEDDEESDESIRRFCNLAENENQAARNNDNRDDYYHCKMFIDCSRHVFYCLPLYSLSGVILISVGESLRANTVIRVS